MGSTGLRVDVQTASPDQTAELVRKELHYNSCKTMLK